MKKITTDKTILKENSDLLQDFFKDIDKYPIYSGDEQIALAKKMKNGDAKARDSLINSNLKFIVTCAKKYQGQGVPLMDLIQAGIYGLILSLDKYDPDKGYKVISFAVWYIRREIIRALCNYGRTIRYPVTYISKITKVKKAYENFIEKNGREPSDEELINLTNLTQKQYKSTIVNKSYCQSLDTMITDDNKLTLEDIIPDESNFSYDPFTKEYIEKSINLILNEREKFVINRYYGLNGYTEKTIKEIAQELGLGEERVRQIRKNSIIKLKKRKEKSFKTLL